MATKEPGYVYILTNPSFREDWVKIGMTQNMEERLKTLDTTEVKVCGKNRVAYKGATYTLSGFCKSFLPDSMRIPSNAYQGPKYFSFQGLTLWKLRLRDEDKLF